MCNKCNKPSCKQDPCIDLDKERISCDTGCQEIIDTDCIFHNMEGVLGKLLHIGVRDGASLTYILKQIDTKLGESINTDFSSFNMNSLNDQTPITNIKQFVEVVSAVLKYQKNQMKGLEENLSEVTESIEDLSKEIEDIEKINVSSSKLNISLTDQLRDVITKMISAIENIPTPIENRFLDSSSVHFDESTDGEISSQVRVSEEQGNIIRHTPDGLYAIPPSVSYILKVIQDTPELKAYLGTIVPLPCFQFDIMSTTNQIITYTNCRGDVVTITARANLLLKLTDVRNIITTPSSSLTITFKGI